MTQKTVLERISGQMGLRTKENTSRDTSTDKENSLMPVEQSMMVNFIITKSKALDVTPR